MRKEFQKLSSISELKIWDRLQKTPFPIAFDLEITARCNLNCRHCYINLPAGDPEAKKSELSLAQIENIADQAVSMGSLWCLITGGEPFLRTDFPEIYLMLKKKGLLVSLYTNASLITQKHIELFTNHPPREIEITIYGITAETYERITRVPGSYDVFRQGLDLLLLNGIKVRLKAMAMRSNISELAAIAAFCRRHTKDYFRFDPLLHLRVDGNATRNAEIRAERLSADEIAAIEQDDNERSTALKNNIDWFIFPRQEHYDCRHLFHCGAGSNGFVASPEGFFRICPSLLHPDCIADLKKTALADSWNNLVPRVHSMTSSNPVFLKKCRTCNIINLCLWCPAHAYLETGKLDGWSEYFCQVAHARADALQLARHGKTGSGEAK